MRQLVITGSGEAVLKETEAPMLDNQPPGAIIQTRYAMIGVGSTLSPVRSGREKPDPSKPDRPVSYQISGIVKEVTPGVEHLKPGDPVCCAGGGFAMNADEVFAPIHLMGKLKDEAFLEQASSVNVACTGLHAVRRSEVNLGEWIVVVGLGMVGQFAAQFAKLSGAYVVGTDIFPLRLGKAKEAGADLLLDPRETDVAAALHERTGGHGADKALMAAMGKDEKLFESVNKMVNGVTGRIVIIGVIPMKRPMGLDTDIVMCGGCGPGWRDNPYKRDGQAYPKEWVRWSTDRNIQFFADTLSEGRLNVEHLITHRFPVEQANEAYTQLIEHPEDSLGIVLKF